MEGEEKIPPPLQAVLLKLENRNLVLRSLIVGKLLHNKPIFGSWLAPLMATRLTRDDVVEMIRATIPDVFTQDEVLTTPMIASALSKWEANNEEFKNVHMSDLFKTAQRRELQLDVLVTYFNSHKDNLKPNSLLEVLESSTGLVVPQLSQKIGGDQNYLNLLEILIMIQEGKKPLFTEFQLDPSWLAPAALKALCDIFSLWYALQISGSAHSSLDDLEGVNGRPYSVNSARDIQQNLVENLKRQISMLFNSKQNRKSGNADFTEEEFKDLLVRWGGDFLPIVTLVSRFKAQDIFFDENRLKKNKDSLVNLLFIIFRNVTRNSFENYKFDLNDPVAAGQMRGLTTEAFALWKTNRASSTLLQKAVSLNLVTRQSLLIGLDQLFSDIEALGLPLSDIQGRELAIAAVNYRGNPKDLFAHLVTEGNVSEDQVIQQLASEIRALLVESLDVQTINRALEILRTIVIQVASMNNQSSQKSLQKINEVKKMLQPLLKADVKKQLIVTAFNHDPRFLLTIGDETEVYSCQNYKTGQYAYYLPSYVVDPNTKALVSWEIRESHFEDPATYHRLIKALQERQIASTEFNGDLGRIIWTTIAGEKIEIKKPAKGVLRNLIRYGVNDQRKPDIYLERDYTSGSAFLKELKGIHNQALHELSREMNVQTRGPITVYRSRNPVGTYSDKGGGRKQGNFVVWVP